MRRLRVVCGVRIVFTDDTDGSHRAAASLRSITSGDARWCLARLSESRDLLSAATESVPADVTLPFVLRVATDGPGYLGTFQYDDGSVSPFILDVGGVNTPDGSALFAGWRDFGNGSRSDLRRLQVKLDGAAGLTGDIDLVHLVTGTERTMTGRVLSASYQPISQPNISGSWSGQAIMRACSGYCPSFQTTGQRVNLTVVLGQSGTAVTGQTQLSLFSCPGCWLPLTGTIADGRLSLSSAAVSRPAPFNDRMQHMESFDASFDALGRIVGRFVYAADSRIAISPFDVSYRVECEILWLSRN